MTIYARFDAAGLPTGFWTPDLYPASSDGARHRAVPEEAVAIGREQWRELLDHAGLRRWDGAGIVPFEPPALSPAPTVTLKTDLIRRCSDGEVAAIEAELASAPPRLRALFAASSAFRSDAEEYGALRAAAERLFGPERAAALLAPSGREA